VHVHQQLSSQEALDHFHANSPKLYEPMTVLSPSTQCPTAPARHTYSGRLPSTAQLVALSHWACRPSRSFWRYLDQWASLKNYDEDKGVLFLNAESRRTPTSYTIGPVTAHRPWIMSYQWYRMYTATMVLLPNGFISEFTQLSRGTIVSI